MRNMMNLKEHLALVEMIKAEYVKSGMNNEEFARHVNTIMPSKFRAPVTAFHVMAGLNALGIESNYRVRARAKKTAKAARINAGECLGLTVRIQELEDQLDRLAVTVGAILTRINK
jgi:hypothetical protein